MVMKFWVRLLVILVNLCGIHEISRAQLNTVYGVFPTINPLYRLNNRCFIEGYYFGARPIISSSQNSDIPVPSWLLWYAEQSISRSFNKGVSITGSYVFQREQISPQQSILEHRLYAQIAKTYTWKNNMIKHRLRHDYRFFKDSFRHRLRYQLMLKHDFSDDSYWTVGQELFFNLSNGSGRIYNENWFNASVGLKLSKHHSLEVGALNVTWHVSGSQWFNQWYLQPTWIIAMN
jgi:hypothetical protein